MSYSSANFALSKSDCYTVAGLVGSIRGRNDPNFQGTTSNPNGQAEGPDPSVQGTAPLGSRVQGTAPLRFRANSEAIF